MAVKIKLKRMGKKRNPQYRIVIADSRTARGGRAIEEVGVYQPRQEPSLIQVESERVQYWLGVGAQPTESVEKLLKITGDWQKFKGEPADGTLAVAKPRADKRQVFEAAVRSAEEAGKAARTIKAPKPEAAKSEPAAADVPGAEAPAAEVPAEPAAEAAAPTA